MFATCVASADKVLDRVRRDVQTDLD